MNKLEEIKRYLQSQQNNPAAKELLKTLNNMTPQELNAKLSSKQGQEIAKQVQQISKQIQTIDEKKKYELMNAANEYLKNMPQDKKQKLEQIIKSLKK